jgi:hypothetical protein
MRSLKRMILITLMLAAWIGLNIAVIPVLTRAFKNRPARHRRPGANRAVKF